MAMLAGSASALAMWSAPPASAAGTTYGGSASGDIVHIDAVNIPGSLDAANVHVAPSTAQVDSGATTISAAPGKASYGRAANVDAQLLNNSVPGLTGLLVEAKQSAPPDNPKPATANLASVPAAPLLNATVADASAHARWLGAQCLPLDTPIATSSSDVATATVLPGSPIAVSAVNSAGGPVTSTSTVSLTAIKGFSNPGVKADQIDQVTGVVLFAGTPNELTVNVLAPPELTAIASGQSAKTSSVTYTEPILQIRQGTTILGTLDAASANTSITIPGLATLSLGALTSKIAADGTSATGTASLLTVALLLPPTAPLNAATIEIAPATVKAFTPAGGVVCPPPINPLDEAHKDSTAAVVGPGEKFTYTVTIPNRASCTVTNVKVVDTITGPAGTTVVSSDPAANSTNGLVLTWNDIGPIAPNETKNLQITVQAPTNMANGAQFHNHADIGPYVCNGQTFNKAVDINFPVGFVPSQPGCFLDSSNKAADHLEVFVGETFNYYIHVFNGGQAPCDSVTVTDPVPANTTFVSASDGGAQANGTVTWDLGTIGPGASRTVVLTVSAKQVPSGTHLPDTATIRSPSEAHPVIVTAPGPAETGTSVLAPPNPAQPPAGRPGTLPRTGGLPLAPYGLGLLVLGFALRGWRRRAHRTA